MPNFLVKFTKVLVKEGYLARGDVVSANVLGGDEAAKRKLACGSVEETTLATTREKARHKDEQFPINPGFEPVKKSAVGSATAAPTAPAAVSPPADYTL